MFRNYLISYKIGVFKRRKSVKYARQPAAMFRLLTTNENVYGMRVGATCNSSGIVLYRVPYYLCSERLFGMTLFEFFFCL